MNLADVGLRHLDSVNSKRTTTDGLDSVTDGHFHRQSICVSQFLLRSYQTIKANRTKLQESTPNNGLDAHCTALLLNEIRRPQVFEVILVRNVTFGNLITFQSIFGDSVNCKLGTQINNSYKV